MDTLRRNKPLITKILITLALIAAYRAGTMIPGPGIEAGDSTKPGDAVGTALLNMFTGGALSRMSIFALGVTPFITASILMQLASVFVPWVAQQRLLGQQGQDKLTQITRYMTVAIAALQAGMLVWAASTKDPEATGLKDISGLNGLEVTALAVGMTAGAIILMRFGEIITEKGLGNGISLLIFASLASTFPAQLWSTWNMVDGSGKKWAIVIGVLVLLVVVTFVEGAQRRVPVRYARQKRNTASIGTYIPYKVNQSNVIPVIFASSIVAVPVIIHNLLGNKSGGWWHLNVVVPLTHPTSLLYIIVTALLVIFFSYYYTKIQHNPYELAENIAKGNGFVPGYVPGRDTGRYLWTVMRGLLSVGAFYLAVVAIIPNVTIHYFNPESTDSTAGVPFAGTALLIMVSVALSTIATYRGERTKVVKASSVIMPQGRSKAVRQDVSKLIARKSEV